MELIEVDSLTFRYLGRKNPTIIDVSLKVSSGDFVLLVGPSGCGKSTLCRCLNGLIPHFYEGELQGEVYVDGLRVRDTPTHVLSQRIGMVFQNPQNQLFSLSVEGDIAFALENLAIPREEIRRRVDEVLKLLRIEHLRDRSPFELSGGQQQKVAIASVLAMRPKILLLDEPTSFLDPLSAQQLFESIDEIRKKLGLTIIMVEHRIELAAPRASRIIVMNKGRIVYDGDVRKFFEEYDGYSYGVYTPKVVRLANEINKRRRIFNRLPLSPEEFEQEVRRYVLDRVH